MIPPSRRGVRFPRRLPLLLLLVLGSPAAPATNSVSSYWEGVAVGEQHLEAERWEAALTTFRRLAQTDPGRYEVELGQGRALLGAGRSAEAVEPLRRAVHLRPDLPRPRVLLGRAWLGQQEYARAEEALLAAYNLDPTFEPAWGELARLYLATRRPALADRWLAAQLAKHPRDVDLLRKRLQVARELGREEVRRETLQQLLAVLPDRQTPSLRRELARCYLAQRDWAAAEAQARAAARLEPGDLDNLTLLAEVLLAAGKPEEAAQVLREVPPEQVGRPELYLALAEAALAAGQAEEALGQARRALALAPNSEAALQIARTAAARLGQATQVVEMSRRLVALRPRDRQTRLNLAADLRAAGQAAEALYQYHLAAEGAGGREVTAAALEVLLGSAQAAGNPAWRLTIERRLATAGPPPPLGWLDALLEQRRYEEAAGVLRTARQQLPDSPDLLARQARLWRETGQWTQAEELLEAALGRSPGHPGLNLERGLLAAAQGNPGAALPFLQRGLGEEGRLPAAGRALADCAVAAGQTEGAAEALRVLLRSYPDGSAPSGAALAALARLYELAGDAAASAAQMRRLADARPERADLARAAAAQAARAGEYATAGGYYERAAAASPDPRSDWQAAARAFVEAEDDTGLLRVAGRYLQQDAHDAEALALVAELGASQVTLSPGSRAALVRLLEAEPWSPAYHRGRVELFASRERLVTLEAALAARAVHTRGPGDRVALALLQQRRGDAEGALRTLSLLPPGEAADPEVAALRAALLRQAGQPEAALRTLERVVAPGAQTARARGELLAEAGRGGAALGEYLRALQGGADGPETLAQVQRLWEAGDVSLRALLAGLGGLCAALPDPAPVAAFVRTHLPGEAPEVREWLEFYAQGAGQ